MRELCELAKVISEQRRRLASLSDRPGGVTRVERLRAEVRLEAAEMAVRLALAIPLAELLGEAASAAQMAQWAVDDAAKLRRAAPRIRSAEENLKVALRERVA
jgi:hypothetical protein